MNQVVGVGVIGCGDVCRQYLSHIGRYPWLKVTACADIRREAADAAARQFHIPSACEPAELLADPGVDIVLDLTIPKAHGPVALTALKAGKHVYQEKPLGVSRKEGLEVLAEAQKRGLKVGCAPDTFMGKGLQTARYAVDAGKIGRPVGFTAFMMCQGHESWHPNPEFHYEPGGGPLFDMGPYYLTALLNLLGPVRRLCAIAAIEIPERTIGSGKKAGKKIVVSTPDHVAGVLEFECGAVGTIVQSFATHHAPNGTITIFGDAGTLQVPDPNRFDGTVRLRLRDQEDWTDLAPVFEYDYARSVGLADMALALQNEMPFRASGQQGMAVLDLMQALLESSEKQAHCRPSVKYDRPAAMPIGKAFDELSS